MLKRPLSKQPPFFRLVGFYKIFTLLAILLLGISLFSVKQSVFADVSDDVEDLTDEIVELERKITNLRSQGKTLKNEIAYFDSQISLTQLRIQNAIAEISKREKLLEELSIDIEDLGIRIEKLSASIDYQTNILRERIRARYKVGDSSPIVILFGSNTFSNLVKKTEYLKIMQIQDQKLLNEMKGTKQAFTIQKNLFEDKKERTEELKAEVEIEKKNLEFYKSDLDYQRAAKNNLLEQTQNDEAKYQADLAKARAQLEAIRSIVAAIDFKDGVDIDKGDIIAVMGNSGKNCSSGVHLHFETRKDGNLRNPEKYLKNKSVPTYDFDSIYSPKTKSLGSGSWDWPMKGRTVTQRYGETPWSRRYPSGRHDGLDMEASDTFIYAPEDGKLVKGSVDCLGSTMNYAAIDHGSDVVSYYLHIK